MVHGIDDHSIPDTPPSAPRIPAHQGFDSSGPIGALTPVAAADGGTAGLLEDEGMRKIWLEVDGAKRQDSVLGEMVWSVPETIARLSEVTVKLLGSGFPSFHSPGRGFCLYGGSRFCFVGLCGTPLSALMTSCMTPGLQYTPFRTTTAGGPRTLSTAVMIITIALVLTEARTNAINNVNTADFGYLLSLPLRTRCALAPPPPPADNLLLCYPHSSSR